MPEGRVVVVGSVNADLVVAVDRLPGPGETVAGGRFARHGGGKGANQAVAAARLGARVALVGAVGADDLGQDALRELEDEDVDVAGVARLEDAPTGVALIVVDAHGENQIAVASGANARLDAKLVERGLALALAGATAGDVAAGMPGGTPLGGGSSGVVAEGMPGGTLLGPRDVVLLSHEVPEEAVLAGARVAAAAGATAILNPAPARELPRELLALHPLLTPNAAEAEALTGERDPAAAAQALRARTRAPVLVTLGAGGALLDGERLPAPRVDAVDTTGAGDTVNGALAAELAEGRPLREAVRFALAAAALSTRAAGARDGMPRREEVSRA